MSDRIVLMRRGRIEQSSAPAELFDRPVSRFVAEFVGFENLLHGTVGEVRDREVALVLPGAVRLTGPWSGAELPRPGQSATLAVRAERIALSYDASERTGERNVLPCRSNTQLYRGKYLDHSVETAVGRVKVRSWDRGSPIEARAVVWRPEDCVVLPA